MSISSIKGSTYLNNGPMGLGPLKFSGNVNLTAAATASIGGHGSHGGAGAVSGLGKAARDMAAFVIIDSFLEAKGIHIDHDALLKGIAVKGALETYKATPGADGTSNIDKISQVALALSTFNAIA